MSKRRNLLIKPIVIGLLVLLLSTCLQGVVYQWNDTSFQYLMTPSGNDSEESDDKLSREDGEADGTWSGSLIHTADVSISKVLSAFFQTDLNWDDRNPKNLMTSASRPASFYKNYRVSGTYNRFHAKMEYQEENKYGKIQYRNQTFAPGRTNTNYIYIKPNPNISFETPNPERNPHTPQLIQDIYTQGKWDVRFAKLDVGGRARISNYNLQYWDTLNVQHPDYTQRNETFLNVHASIPTVPFLSVLTNVYAKQDGTDKYYDMTHYGVGLAYDRKFDFFHMLDASVQYDRMNSNAYPSERDHYMTTQMRYTHRVGSSFTAFVSYINRSVYSTDEKSMLLISNVVRLQARYSFANDISGDAYVIVGGKLSQENKTSLVFTEFNYPIVTNLYVNVADKYSPTYLIDNSGVKDIAHENEASLGLSYYFTPWQLVYVSDTFSVFGKKGLYPATQQLISFGTKLVF